MPHAINIDGISESLFFLQNLVHASRSFCRAYKVSWGGEATGEYDWDYYYGWLKSQLCDHLIQVSTKIRILEDILRANQEDIDFRTIDAKSRDGIVLGSFHSGNEELTLREACNKIIHATDTQLDWAEEEDFEYWTGKIWLTGARRAQDWKLELHIEPFSIAVSRCLNHLEEVVDWHHLYKYDR